MIAYPRYREVVLTPSKPKAKRQRPQAATGLNFPQIKQLTVNLRYFAIAKCEVDSSYINPTLPNLENHSFLSTRLLLHHWLFHE
jgi:hypothetical protein